MKVKCLHEVYFQPKMFQTVGFHHQGTYNICVQVYSENMRENSVTFGYPIAYAKQRYSNNLFQFDQSRVNEELLQYSTHKFEVEYNEQQFVFDSGACRFKLQLQLLEQQSHPPIFLLLKLVKYAKENNEKLEGQQMKAVYSTENIIKNTIEDSKQYKSYTKDNKKQNKKQKKKKKQLPVQTVNEVLFEISTKPLSFQTTDSMYQKVLFPEQQFFGKLFFMISHARIGYSIRYTQLNLRDFKYKYSVSGIDIQGYVKFRQSIRNSQAMLNKNEDSQQNPQQILYYAFSDTCFMYQRLIKQQIIEYKRISNIIDVMRNEIEMHNSMRKTLTLQEQNSSTQRKSTTVSQSYSINQSLKITSLDVQISLPASQVYCSQEALLQYYQCQHLQQLYITIYNQSKQLNNIINYKWHCLLKLMSRKMWSTPYFFHTIRNFKANIEYVRKYVQNNFDMNQAVGPQNEPNLKYRYYVHKNLPQLFIKQTMRSPNSLKPGIQSENTLFVLVHGFNGNQHDMNRIKSLISYFTGSNFILLKSITSIINESLDRIGKAAAQQIIQFLKTKPGIRKINFIGFSLGGVIIRASLPYLKQYHHMFNILITLSSPHLGIREVKHCIVKTGLQILNYIKRTKNIRQLMLEIKESKLQIEQKKSQTCEKIKPVEQLYFMQKIANNKYINVFNLVILCGSPDDKYVPGYSAILDYHGDCQYTLKMQKTLKNNIKNLHQIYVKFNSVKKGSLVQRVIGRRVHINFLDDDSFLHYLFSQYYQYF